MELLKELLKLDEKKKAVCDECDMPKDECTCEEEPVAEDLTEGKIKKPKKQKTSVYNLPMKKGRVNNASTVAKAVAKTDATTKDANSTGIYKQPIKKGSVNNSATVSKAVGKVTKVTKDGKSVGKYKSKAKASASAAMNTTTVKAAKKKVS